MAYPERFDGRKTDEMRPIEAKAGVIKNADGSAWFKIGKTEAYAAVYGPRNLHPRFLQNPKRGLLRCYYNMLPFSGSGNRIRPGGNRRSKEISMVTMKALDPVLDLTAFPNAVVDVFIEFPQTDAGSRCAGISAAAMALADAGIPMREMVASVAVGRVDDKILADLDYSEEAYDGPVADIPMAVTTNTKEITLLQMDGEISSEDLRTALNLGIKISEQIHKVQREALLERFKEGSQ